MLKRIVMIVALLICTLVIVFIGARYGWRLWGLKACSSPEQIYVSDVQIHNNNIVVKGQTCSSADSYIGYAYKESNHKLYIGLKYNLLFGFIKRDGSFYVKLPYNTDSVKEIYLSNTYDKKLIWSNNEYIDK